MTYNRTVESRQHLRLWKRLSQNYNPMPSKYVASSQTRYQDNCRTTIWSHQMECRGSCHGLLVNSCELQLHEIPPSHILPHWQSLILCVDLVQMPLQVKAITRYWPSSEFVKRPVCYVCTHIFEILSNKWVQQSHNGSIHFHLMAFVSHTYLLCTINCHNIVA